MDNFCTFTPLNIPVRCAQGKFIYFTGWLNRSGIFINILRMIQFLGNMEAKADAKGRIFVPALFRKHLQSEGEEYLVLRKDIFQECLVLYPGSVWEKVIETLREKLGKWNKKKRNLLRQFVLDAERLEMDANGRVLIPKRYLQMVSIESDVRFLGVDDTIEIWAKEKLEKPLVDPDEFSLELQQLMEME